LGFSPAGFVWHHRRSTIRAYLKQQAGYGEAEALLMRKHPEYFSFFGGGIWRGRIYTASKFGVILRPPLIYHGLFGSGFFQKLYSPEPAFLLMFCTSLEYHVLVVLPLLVLSSSISLLLPVALAGWVLALGVCTVAAAQAELPKKKRRTWSRPLVALLFFLQPIVRGWARYHERLTARSEPPVFKRAVASEPVDDWKTFGRVAYWSESGGDRYGFLHRILAKLQSEGWQHKTDTGWSAYDVEIFGSRWSRLRLTTATEELAQGHKVYRCHLNATWSLPARIAFWSTAGVELFIIGLVAPSHPWIWMLLLSLAGFGWGLEQEKHRLVLWITALLDEIGAEQKMVKIRHRPKDEVRT
jgi:hypothetical protein